MHPEIVQECRQRELQADPGLAEKVKKSPKADRELTEKVIAKHGKQKSD